jgi:SpoIID/LytB domain
VQADKNIWINIFDEQKNDIVRMGLDDVVKRITTHELPDKFEIEAARAVTVAVRSSVVKRLKKFDGVGCESHRGADICTSMKGCGCITNLETLKNIVGEKFDDLYSLASEAEDSTSGLIITCGGKPIGAEYHITCGGGTENSEDIVGNRVMYLRKVLCDYCSNSPYWENRVDIPVQELEERLSVKILRGTGISGSIMDGIIDDVKRDETGRVRSIKIGGKYFTGVEIKNLLGLSSSRFGWDPLVIRFIERGHGSGLGMCLYGANSMAASGKDFKDILQYYYTNTMIEDMESTGQGEPLKGRTFIIDPGHGGEDGGDEKGPTGLREKDVNLYIAKRLMEYLSKDGAKVILTRTDDKNVPLPQRVEMVNNIRPNFFVSIHQNSFFSPGVSGTEVYYFKGDDGGEKIGTLILKSIIGNLGTTNRGNRTADFYILRESKVSSVVVECMYITNPKEEERLRDDGVKDEIAKSIYRGIIEYYGI